ncbi:uncharacterized protein LOC111482016 [Cucurbita maxima]|uniref:Uncharacterized protein LOC111482016 n=1 Tax=Cucurbita maxima TaxID=3661 RepID=A0A6J1J244_CUCMA|nr:uncharacterized protein LOC111482016 [Cucurbita maxima]
MKASIIFREDQRNPIFRAKIPLNFFGFPFRSVIELAEPDNLSFTFSSFFRSGPSFNFSYRPNDSLAPFTLALKAGIGLFGSSIHSPMNFTAEFNLPGNKPPLFFLHFRPRLGDFTLRRSVQSHTATFNLPLDDDLAAMSSGKSVHGGESSGEVHTDLGLGNTIFSGQRIHCSGIYNRVHDLLSTGEINARSTFKVKNSAAVKFQWCMRFPMSMKKEEFTAKVMLSKIPYLALRKIKIELAAASDSERESNEAVGGGEISVLKKHLEDLRTESLWMKKYIEQLRSEIGDQMAAPANPPVESRKKR